MRVRAQDANGDMLFGASSLNFLVNSPDCVAQLVLTGLQLFQGTWFLNLILGMTWMTNVIGDNPQSVYDAAIQNQVLGTQGVTGIDNYLSSLDSSTRALAVSFSLQTIFGPIAIATSIPYIPPAGFGIGPFGDNPFGA